MQKHIISESAASVGPASALPLTEDTSQALEGALVNGDAAEDDKIAVIYNRGDTPPEITITETAGQIQTVLADGVAVAIVARADGPRLTTDDVLLVERFVARAS